MISRRELLVGAGALLAGCDTQRPQRGLLGSVERFNGKVQAALFSPTHLAETASERALTPLAAFPQYKIGSEFPDVPAGWVLEVGGMVANPVRLELPMLQKLGGTELRVRHHCVEGWSAVASWQGVRVSELRALVKPAPEARFVEFVSFEAAPERESAAPDAKAGPGAPAALARTYTSSWDLESALHPQTLLAYGMNGQPLPLEHGGPLRLYSAVKLGYKMVKWLAAVRFLPEPTGGYWEDQGYEWFAGV
ncbi:MAG: molybdopterin-dependent oxidoreductase [Deltaproteobacteria bacterium]|nr:molybdopterin-dependent oxidoreductase [Deltaproteobacteria bacterium]